jgi:hypothetical protein
MIKLFSPLIFCFALIIGGCAAPPKTTVTKLPDTQTIRTVDDTYYAAALKKAVTGNGVDYTPLRTDTNLSHYLQELAQARLDIFPSRQSQLAFWINAHNAYVLDLIRLNNLRGVKSINDISGFRTSKVAAIAGKYLSLKDIGHKIIESEFREPRAFFALYLGARSSPKLLDVPYNSEHLSEQLDAATRTFLADSTKNKLDAPHNTIYLSEVFREYREALERSAGNLRLFVRAFAPSAMAEHIDVHPLVQFDFYKFDWTIH